MLKMLEKLINEHGSATILKERLGLKDDQIESIQNEYSSLTQENERLTLENRNLKTSLHNSEAEVSRLLQLVNSDSSSGIKLSENELKLLRFLFDQNSAFYVDHLSQVITADHSTTKYHLNNLLDAGMLGISKWIDTPDSYSISDEGIKYIVESKIT